MWGKYDIYVKNPVIDENDYKGRKISQVIVDNKNIYIYAYVNANFKEFAYHFF